MYTLAVPKGVHADRTRSYLKNEIQVQDRGIDFREDGPDVDGFVTITFMSLDEDQFRYIVERLKAQGVSMIGVDSQLTENKIMKLANLLKENPMYSNRRGYENQPANPEMANYPGNYSSPDMDRGVPVAKLRQILDEWRQKYATGYYRDPQHRADEYFMDIEGLVEFYENFHHDNKKQKDTVSLQEQKLRKIIRDELKRAK